jgi:hypothetical protein
MTPTWFDRFSNWCARVSADVMLSTLIAVLFLGSAVTENWLAAAGWFAAYVATKKNEAMAASATKAAQPAEKDDSTGR